MNFKTLVVVGLTLATLGMSLPAHADSATDITSDQNAIITGDGNVTGQSSSVNVRNRERGRGDGSSTGTIVDHRQNADVQGHDNVTAQDASANVDNDRDTRHNRRRY